MPGEARSVSAGTVTPRRGPDPHPTHIWNRKRRPHPRHALALGKICWLLKRMPGTTRRLGTVKMLCLYFYVAARPRITPEVRDVRGTVFGFASGPEGPHPCSTSHEHFFVAGLECRPHFFNLSMHSLRSAVRLPELKKRSPPVGDEKASETVPSGSLKAVVQCTTQDRSEQLGRMTGQFVFQTAWRNEVDSNHRYVRGRAVIEMSRLCLVSLAIFIVQPGVSKAGASHDQLELLSVTENHLMETFRIPFGVIASS